MQSSVKVNNFKSPLLPTKRQSNPIVGLSAFVIFLPQALAFAAASGTEAKAELYTAVVIGTFLVAIALARGLNKPQDNR